MPRVKRAAEHRQDEDRAFRDGRVIGRHVEHQQDVDHHHQDIGAEHRAERPAAPAAQARAADDDGGEHLQQHRIADQRIGRAGLRADEHAGETVAAAADHIDQELRQPRAHADGARRLRNRCRRRRWRRRDWVRFSHAQPSRARWR